MTNEIKLDLLLQRGIVRTHFDTIKLGVSASQGVQIGQGSCVAVILRLNKYVLNGALDGEAGLPNVNAVPLIYYGDSTRQQYELLAGVNSNIIFANKLDDIYVRNYIAEGELEDYEAFVQVQIYLGKDAENVQMYDDNQVSELL